MSAFTSSHDRNTPLSSPVTKLPGPVTQMLRTQPPRGAPRAASSHFCCAGCDTRELRRRLPPRLAGPEDSTGGRTPSKSHARSADRGSSPASPSPSFASRSRSLVAEGSCALALSTRHTSWAWRARSSAGEKVPPSVRSQNCTWKDPSHNCVRLTCWWLRIAPHPPCRRKTCYAVHLRLLVNREGTTRHPASAVWLGAQHISAYRTMGCRCSV